MRLTTKLLAVAALALHYAVVPAQDLTSWLKDSKFPQKIKPADLGEDMKAFKIVYEKQGGGDFLSMLMNPMMMLMGSLGSSTGAEGQQADPQESLAMKFFDRLSISWTNGSTVKLYEQEFLVTYSTQVNMAEAVKSKNPPDISGNELVLTLINTKSIASITPRLDMTKEEWLKPNAPPQEANQGSAAPENAKSLSISNLKQISTAMMIYAADYEDLIPYAQSTKGVFEVVYPYVKSKDTFKSLNPNGSKFLMNMALAGVSFTSIPSPVETVLFYESKEWPDGTRLVAFADGHVKSVSSDTWVTLASTLTIKLPKTGKPLPASLGSNWDGS